jgi:exonuclease III
VKSVSAMDTDAGIISGRPYGGIAILWRKSLGHLCKINDYNDSRLLGLSINIEGIEILIVNVYLPYYNGSNLNEYIDYLSRLHTIIDQHATSYVYVIGDFNANICRTNPGRSCFANELATFCEEEDLILSDFTLLDPDTFTYTSHAHNTVGWLDHILTTNTGHLHIKEIEVKNSFISSDHLPVSMELDFTCLRQKVNNTPARPTTINWRTVSDEDISKYRETTASNLAGIADELAANREAGIHDSIDRAYKALVDGLTSAGNALVTDRSRQASSRRPIPGWNDYVRDAHEEARDAFLLWQANAKPRHGPICDLMRSTRARFKTCLRHCRAVESRAVADAIANKFVARDKNDFWREIRRIGKSDSVNALSIDGATGDRDIANLWKNHYENILNGNNNRQSKTNVLNFISTHGSEDNLVLQESEVKIAIEKLKSDKCAGMDGLQSEHFKFANNIIVQLLTNLFNSMLAHGYLPQALMDTCITPIIKDKKGLVTSSDNYRPIAITSVASKILELVLLEKMKTQLETIDNQFGFKKNSGTDMCVFTLQQIIEYYTKRSSPIYICFLDASKAFDRINHWKLFEKLIKRNVNKQIIRLIVRWYCTQSFYVRWGGHISDCFNVTNGVRQGGILSPYLFNVYMNDLSVELNNSNNGCVLNGITMNHLMYADDTCLLAPSPAALQHLLDICSEFARLNDIVFNEGKTKLMCYRSRLQENLPIPDIVLNGTIITVVDEYKYLGIMLQCTQSNENDMKRQIRSMYARGNVLVSRFRNCSTNVKNWLFRTYFSNAYGCQTWTNYRKATYQKVRVAYNDIYRRLFNIQRGESISAIFVRNHIDSFCTLRRKIMYSLKCRLYRTGNLLIKSIVESDQFAASAIYKEWQRSLHVATV